MGLQARNRTERGQIHRAQARRGLLYRLVNVKIASLEDRVGMGKLPEDDQ